MSKKRKPNEVDVLRGEIKQLQHQMMEVYRILNFHHGFIAAAAEELKQEKETKLKESGVVVDDG